MQGVTEACYSVPGAVATGVDEMARLAAQLIVSPVDVLTEGAYPAGPMRQVDNLSAPSTTSLTASNEPQ